LCCVAHTVVCANIVKATKFDLSRARTIGFPPSLPFTPGVLIGFWRANFGRGNGQSN